MMTNLRMHFAMASMLAAAMPAAAPAATFTSIELRTTGSGFDALGSSSSPYINAIFTFVAPTAGDARVMSATPNSLRFAATQQFLAPSFPTLTATTSSLTIAHSGFTAIACYSAPSDGLLPTAGFMADPACSSIALDSYLPRQRRFYTGRITEVRIRQFDADDSPLGLLAITNAIPEPSTWALMLTGFGLAAYRLRRRRHQTAITCSQQGERR